MKNINIIIILAVFMSTHNISFAIPKYSDGKETFQQKDEGVTEKSRKKNFLYKVDPDLLPLSFILSPCMNFIWHKAGSANDKKTMAFGSLNIIRLTLMYDLQILKSNFFVSFGIGWIHQDFQFRDQYALFKYPYKKVKFIKADEVVANLIKASDNVKSKIRSKKSSISTKYLEGTIEFQFRQKRKYYKEGFFLALGTRLGYSIHPTTSIKYYDGTDKNDLKSIRISENLGINPFKCSGILRLGYSIFGVFLDWTFTNMFISSKFSDKQTDMRPLSFGLSIDFF